MPVSFVDVFSQYELLLLLGRHLSYPDLVNLGQSNKDLHSLLLSNTHIRMKLKSHAICSGQGLATRRCLLKKLKEVDEDLTGDYVYAEEDDDPQAYSRTCQTYDSHPCMSCGEAVCEACRSTPRVPISLMDLPRDMYTDVVAPAHRSFVGEMQYLVAYCTGCDPSATTLGCKPLHQSGPKRRTVAAADLDESYCSCNRFARWICHPCDQKEKRDYLQYKRRHFSPFATKIVDRLEEFANTNADAADNADNAMFLPLATARSAYISMMLCPCGQPAHRMSHIWCFLCRKKHKSTVHRLQDGAWWRRLWYGSDDEWDEAWSIAT